MSAELVDWLRAQLDEDERSATAATPGVWQWTIDGSLISIERDALKLRDVERDVVWGDGSGLREVVATRPDADHIVAWQPARVLAEVAAKRAILDLHADGYHSCIRDVEWITKPVEGGKPYMFREVLSGVPCQTLQLLAQPYRGQAGWRDEWGTE